MDVAQALEDVLAEVDGIRKEITKLKTASVSGQALRSRIKEANKAWLPISGLLEKGTVVDSGKLQEVNEAWSAAVKLANKASPKVQYRVHLKTIAEVTESSILHAYIKGSAIESIGDDLRKLVQPVSDPDLLRYLDESVQCAESGCIKASVVLAWCAVAHCVHAKLKSLGVATLNAEFAAMKQDKGLLFRTFTREYVLSSELDIAEVADAHLILLCRRLGYLDDTQYKHLRAALDLRNGCGHPTGYEPDAVKLQAFYADVSQLVLLNQTFR